MLLENTANVTEAVLTTLFDFFQTGLQIFLVVIAVLSVPVLLLGKPVYLYWLHNGSHRLGLYRVSVFKCINVCEYVLERE